MPTQERTVHVFDGGVDLSDYPGEVVARNDRWTSFRPKKPTTFDSLPISKDTGFVVFDMWFIDDEGIVSRVHQHGLLVGVFALPDHENAHTGSDLADVFELYDAITKAEMNTLKKQHAAGKGFTKWVMAHGLEKLLGLPEVKILAAAPATKKAAAAPAKKKAAAAPAKKKAAAPAKKKAAAPTRKKAAAPTRKKAAAKPKKKAARRA